MAAAVFFCAFCRGRRGAKPHPKSARTRAVPHGQARPAQARAKRGVNIKRGHGGATPPIEIAATAAGSLT